MTNVLITSIGYKVPLIEEFRAALGQAGQLVGVDADASSPARSECHMFLVAPKVDSDSWPSFMRRVITEHDIGLVVPGADRDLEPLFKLRQQINDLTLAMLVTSELHSLSLLKDKFEFANWCRKEGYPTAMAYPVSKNLIVGNGPWLLRPRRATAGAHNLYIDNPTLLVAYANALEGQGINNNFFIQDAVTLPEYSIDTLLSLDAKPLQAVVRRRLVVRGGESMRTIVENIPELESLSLNLCASLNLVGHNVVQAFWSHDCGASLIEVNHRFGGASRLSIRAGLNSPSRLIRLALGDTSALVNKPIRYGLAMQRIATDRFIEPQES